MAEWFDLTSAWIPKLSGWSFVRPIKITEQSGNNLSDYQVLIELNSSNFDFSKAKADGGDIRFLLPSGKSIPYWIESWDKSGQSAKVWVKVPSIPANSSTVIYMAYGNPSASSESNGDNVFEFFDDFESGTLDKWTILNGGGSGSATIVERDGKKWVELHSPDCNNRVAIVSEFPETVTENSKYIVETYVYTISVSDGFLVGFGDGTIGSASDDFPPNMWAGGEYGRLGNAKHRVTEKISGTMNIIDYADFSLSSDTYYDIYYKHYANQRESNIDSNTVSGTTSNTGLSCTHVHLSTCCGGKYDFDYVRVRKYTSPEPTLTVGPEIWL